MFTPSDKMVFQKRGDSLRLDFSIVNFKGIYTKKRKTSIIFNPLNIDPSYTRGGNKLFMLNHKYKRFSRLLSSITKEEKKLILKDIFRYGFVRDSYSLNKFDLCYSRYGEQKGNKVTIDGLECDKYVFKIDFSVMKDKINYSKVPEFFEKYKINCHKNENVNNLDTS